MNKSKLKNIIELVVRKEIKKQLSEIFINEDKEIKLSEVISKPKPNIVKKKTKCRIGVEMKKNDLIKIIELVVRKEVKKQMTEIFINDKEEIKLSEVISKPKVKKQITKKQYSKNTALNEVLNKTKPLGSSQTDEYPSLGGGVLGSDNMAEVLGYGNLGGVQNKEMAREMAAVDTIKKQGVSVDQVPTGVQDALTRDYSGLMKAIDKKKTGEGGFRP